MRLDEVRRRVNSLDPQSFGEGGFYLTSAKEVLRGELAELKGRLPPFRMPTEWVAGDTDCLTELRVLSLHGEKAMRSTQYPSPAQFLTDLKTKTAAREQFPLLAERYSWPLNFSLEAESEIREQVLLRLMTKTRAAIEKHSIRAADADEFLLPLNLIAVHACTTTDLRFVDALNYYHELMPATLGPESQHAWLLVSYLAIYARALLSWS